MLEVFHSIRAFPIKNQIQILQTQQYKPILAGPSRGDRSIGEPWETTRLVLVDGKDRVVWDADKANKERARK
jgi:hypothetical protein